MKPMPRALLCLGLLPALAWQVSIDAANEYRLVKLPAGTDALCLDGSPAAYYLKMSSTGSTDWQFYFEGGGWCYKESDCYERSKGGLGSSKHYGPTAGDIGGVMSSDCKVNPTFCNFNKVYMKYCDGNSFSGNRDQPVNDGANHMLYFRGHRVPRRIVEDLASRVGEKFRSTTTVHLTGCSAGGLATFLHTDYFRTLLPKTVVKYGSSPISGFFLLHNNAEGQPVYPNEMEYIYKLSNSTAGMMTGCAYDTNEAEQWKCNFAQYAYKYLLQPIFPLNSAYDSWQMDCIFGAVAVPANSNRNGNCAALPGWQACAQDANKCSEAQMKTYNQYRTDFLAIMRTKTTASKTGNGGFIYSCHTHCAGQSGAYQSYHINGVSMAQAVDKWWKSNFHEAAEQHSYWPCELKSGSPPRKCNPSCGAAEESERAFLAEWTSVPGSGKWWKGR